ncbi:exosortase F system-associated protein [uncultured Polaribacter sp.]|uniref:exosortase F system-associated membrane protein n=1 Tax=uncultured Polaribacter sp. TaxID=174711 RepID=UPI00260398D4|nr:exosortase F system-associated protein [uncultured Polaribacter sp.]
MNKYLKILLILAAFSALVLVRAFAADLFYDPLVTYFKNDYLYSNLPTIDIWRLITNLLFRYSINASITLLLIWLFFEKKDFLKLTAFFLITAFIVLIIPFIFLLKNEFETGYLLPFYIRRFIIHPLFLLILLPAFYFQKLNK